MPQEFRVSYWSMAQYSHWWNDAVSSSTRWNHCNYLIRDRDRAQYDATISDYVLYTVAAPTDAPAVLTYGSSFMSLAATYAGTVVLGECGSELQRESS
jgi:hypothetical protein